MTPRTLNSEIDAERAEYAFLYELNHSGGVIRMTNASRDVIALGETWTAVGGSLLQGAVPDVADRKAQGVDLELFGVSQTIIALIQINQFRGRNVLIYLIMADPDTGEFGDPDLIFRGRQNSDYKVTEDRDFESTESGGTAKVRTRISADLSQINSAISCRSNVPSHQEFLRRAGIATDDEFFSRVSTIMNKTIFWGTADPDVPALVIGYTQYRQPIYSDV